MLAFIGSWADSTPLLQLYAAVVALLLLSSELGVLLGRFVNRHVPAAERKTIGGGTTGAVAGLLAFMLAFTFSSAATRFQERKQLVVDEANAIGTAYLRSQLVADAQGSVLRQLLRGYVEDRAQVNLWDTDEKIALGLSRAEAAQALMWAQVTDLATNQPGSVAVGLLASAVNDVIDMHGKRVAIGLRARVPSSIWTTVMFLAIVSTLLMAYDMGLSASRSTLATLAMAMTFSAVMLLIVDLDRPHQAMFSVSQDAMNDLLRSFGPVGR